MVTDSNVGLLLYGERVLSGLRNNSGFKTCIITVPAGEKSESVEMLVKLYNEMLEFGLTRTDLIIALGGGVVGDLYGLRSGKPLAGNTLCSNPHHAAGTG